MGLYTIAQGNCAIRSTKLRIFLAEAMGTFILCLIAIGQSFNGNEGSTAGPLCTGLAVCLGIYAAANVSGGHINPAVTFGFAIQGRLGHTFFDNLFMLIIYISAQITGAFCGAGVASLINFNKVKDLEGVAGTCMLATCANQEEEIDQGLLFFDLMTGGWILVSTVLATTDPKNANPPGLAPFFIGLSATAVGLSYGASSGGAANPARDLGPRLMALLIFGEEAFSGSPDVTNSEYFFWLPLVAPAVGGALAGITYLFFIMAHWKEENIEVNEQNAETTELTRNSPLNSIRSGSAVAPSETPSQNPYSNPYTITN